MNKIIVLLMIVAAIANTCFGYGVKGMRWGVRKGKYSSSNSYTKSEHGINGCGVKGCHGSACKSRSTYSDYVAPTPKREEKPHDWNKDIRTGLAVVRTANQTASTINRITNSNARIEISRENLEVRKYNSDIDSKYGMKNKNVPTVVNVENQNWQEWYKSRYEYFKERYEAETNKNSNLAKFYLSKMKEYEDKLEKK